MKKIKELYFFIRDFLIKEIWLIRNKGVSPTKAFLIKQVKIILITIKGYRENNVMLSASALTFYSMMSVVPIVAMAFGIAKGFGFEKMLTEQLTNKLSGQQEVLKWIITFANSMLEKTKGGLVAGVGLVLLFYSVMRVLGNIESSFNEIWHVKQSRSWFRKFSDYLAIMLIAPIFIILSSSFTVYISTQIHTIVHKIELLGYLAPVLVFLVKMIPYTLVWVLFSFIYIVMPNTVVKFSSGIIGGIIAGTAFQVTQWAYLKFQIGMSNYNAIYGSFAALPLFMIWLHIGWQIVLFGAELSYATQNYEKYELGSEASNISVSYKRALSLLIVYNVVKAYHLGEKSPNISDISKKLEIPSRVTRDIINNLNESGILSKVIIDEKTDYSYQPAIDINKLTIKEVFDRLDSNGVNNLSIAQVPEMDIINEHLRGFSMAVEVSASNVLVKDMI